MANGGTCELCYMQPHHHHLTHTHARTHAHTHTHTHNCFLIVWEKFDCYYRLKILILEYFFLLQLLMINYQNIHLDQNRAVTLF